MAKHPGGRPAIIDALILQKLEEVYALGGTDKEACFYADIAPATLYNYQKANPEFVERKEELKARPILLARQTVVKSLQNDVNSAWKMLERRDPDMHPKQQIDHTTKGEKIDTSDSIKELTQRLNELYRGSGIPSDGETPRLVDDSSQN